MHTGKWSRHSNTNLSGIQTDDELIISRAQKAKGPQFKAAIQSQWML